MTQPNVDPSTSTDPNASGSGDPGTSQPPAAQPSQPQQPAATPPTAPQFTQADLDRIITQRLAEKDQQHAAALREAEERAGKSELEAAQLDVEKYKTEAEQAAERAAVDILQARVIAAIADSDVKKDRRPQLARLLDTTDLAGKPAAEQTAAITAQVEKLLEDMPEWRAAAVPGSAGAPGKHNAATLTLDQFKRMTVTERSQLYADRPDEYKRLQDAEAAAAWQ